MYVEPGAQYRQYALACKQLYNAFVEVGFDEEESFNLLTVYIESQALKSA